MPTEFRFDDLDLREEPAHGSAPSPGLLSNHNTCYTNQCVTTTDVCSDYCCATYP